MPCTATSLVAKMRQITYPLHLSLCHSEAEWVIAISMCALTAQMMPLYRVKIWNFGPVTPEKTGLICILFLRKTGIFSEVSQDILDQFLESFHHVKAL